MATSESDEHLSQLHRCTGINYMPGSLMMTWGQNSGPSSPKKSRKSRSADDNKRDPVAYVDVAMNDAVEKAPTSRSGFERCCFSEPSYPPKPNLIPKPCDLEVWATGIRAPTSRSGFERCCST
uniref:Uncharacterized protein n=1 Tax=Populus alba TaxID=43335 RepID=A0A4U5PQA5_POPAL|nr:hypothetical protein D5086_0000195670 [Populus alba]